MPFTLNQRHKLPEDHFNLLHIVILFLQGEFKISPLSPAKAGPFPLLEFLLLAPPLQPVAPCKESALPSCTNLGTTREGFTAALWAAESLGSWVPHHPWGPAQLSPASTLGRRGRPISSPGGDCSCSTGSSMGVPAQGVGLLSPLPAPSLGSLQCLSFPLGTFPTWVLLAVTQERRPVESSSSMALETTVTSS